jgi:cyclopropane fatty-acyl-phospholipid synthase-like methyltransferase
MKLADRQRDYRVLVQRGYDAASAVYNQSRATEQPLELAPLLERLAPGATVLDLGCGTGMPVARALSAASHRVVGVDFSDAQLRLAKVQAPDVRLIRADISRCHFKARSFDAVVSFYAIFHLPLAEQPPLIARIAEWLRPGGHFLATLSPEHEEGYTEDFFGVDMFWSNYGMAEYREMLASNGLEVLNETVAGHGYSDETAKVEVHPLVLAKKLR